MSFRSLPQRRSTLVLLGVVLLLLGACTGALASGSHGAASSTSSIPTTTTTTIPSRDLPLPAGANTVYIIGDSVILGTQYVIDATLAGWQVVLDAKVNRRMDQGIDLVRSKGGLLGRVIVVHLCTNWFGGDYGAAADELISMLKGADRIVWSTCAPWVGSINDANAAIKALPDRHPNLKVVDWAAISATPGYTAGDGLHLQGQGQHALADLVAAAIGPVPPPA